MVRVVSVTVGEEREPYDESRDLKIVLRRSRNSPYYFIEGRIKPHVIKALEEDLSFYIEGYQYTDKYLSGEWDGREILLYRTRSGETYYFPVGMLEKVQGNLEDFDIKYSVDNSEERDPRHISLKCVSKKKLYPDQKDAVDAVVHSGGGTVCMPTGAGKTMVAVAVMARYQMPTLIVVHRKELVNQWKIAIEEAFGVLPGLVGAGRVQWEDVTVAMVQTIGKLKKFPKEFDLLILDEAHHTPARNAYRIALRCNALIRIGLSATPTREDGAELKIFAAVGEIVYESKPDVLIGKERIAKPEFRFLSVPYPSGIHRGMPFHEIYTLGITANRGRNERIVEVAEELLNEKHIVYIHVEEIAHGKYLSAKIAGSKFISGSTPKRERERAIWEFSERKIRCLVSTLLGEGVDIPAITAIIMAGGRKTEAGCIQKAGRALRITPEKRTAVVVDFMDKGVHLSDHWQLRYKAYCKYYGNQVKGSTGAKRS